MADAGSEQTSEDRSWTPAKQIERGIITAVFCTFMLLVLGGGGSLLIWIIQNGGTDTPPEMFGWELAFWIFGGSTAIFGSPISLAIAIYFAKSKKIQFKGLITAAMLGGICCGLVCLFLWLMQ